MYLGIVYVWMHSKIYKYRKAKTTYDLEWIEYMSRVLGSVLHGSSLFFTEKQLLQKMSARAPP
jgi:hypothetical protein